MSRKITKKALSIILCLLIMFSISLVFYYSKNFISEYVDISKMESQSVEILKLKPNLNENNGSTNFENIRSEIPDYIAWLTIDETNIDYPIVQTIDNSFYLNHLPNKEESSVGAIFLDCNLNSDFSNPHNIVYGHNMKNEVIFGILNNFMDSDFFDSHENGMLITLNSKYSLKLLAVTVTKENYPYEISFETKDNYVSFINTILSNSLYKKDLEIPNEPKILSLSTCTNLQDSTRTIVHYYMEEVR